MPEQVDAFWHGQSGEQLVEMTGWIGEHPLTGADVAHLMLRYLSRAHRVYAALIRLS